MFKFLVSFVILGSAISAFADGGDVYGRLNFSTLTMMAANSSQVSYSDVKGPYAGRCFFYYNPEQMYAGSLWIGEVAGQKRIAATIGVSNPVDFYDTYTVQQYETEYEGVLKTSSIAIGEKPLMGSLLDSNIYISGTAQGLVMTYVYLGDQVAGSLHKGVTAISCLYGKKLN